MPESLSFTEVTTYETLQSHNEALNNMEIWEIVVVILFVIVITGSFIGNTLIIAVFFRFKNLQNATNCLICNQSIADLLSALTMCLYISITYFPAGKLFVLSHKYACLLCLCINCVSLLGSLVNIMAISIERAIAVALPYVNINPHKKKIVLLWIVVTWIGILISSSLPIVGLNRWKYGTPCNVYFVFEKWHILNCILYTMIVVLVVTALLNITIGVCALRRHLRRSKVAPQTKVNSQVNSTSKIKNKSNPTIEANKRRITTMLLVVVGVFYMFWVPYISVTCYSLFNPMRYRTKTNLIIFHEFTKVFFIVNGLLNPFIYANKNPQFKKAFKEIFDRRG
ncbi:hypothetical protein CAPTEDRAFT_201500 [Capitella teleta]|uniref:G-protein coupled receptors family 1 profile domain-containing protein n=1 Tax=Capitella teleta TaxID=283909 RepID=R7UF13_CAPTE|nr:hypothetical protein CAPTEDRAFT_201500 [Capitella teleta]|eukprot:ELU04805.1 hypothetical protein CAPTEDRAFT_201500 [Capitella teleta]